jgi:hypothetical protein
MAIAKTQTTRFIDFSPWVTSASYQVCAKISLTACIQAQPSMPERSLEPVSFDGSPRKNGPATEDSRAVNARQYG